MRNKIGVKASDIDPANEEIAAHLKKLGERFNKFQERRERRGPESPAKRAQGPELDEAKQNVQKAIASLQSEPNKTYISALDRIDGAAREHVAARRPRCRSTTSVSGKNLESATSVSAAANGRADQGRQRQPRRDCSPSKSKHEEERGTLLTKVDQLQTDNRQETRTRSPTSRPRHRQPEDDFARKHELASIIRELPRQARTEQRERSSTGPMAT